MAISLQLSQAKTISKTCFSLRFGRRVKTNKIPSKTFLCTSPLLLLITIESFLGCPGGKIEQSGMQRIKSELHNLDPAALGNYVTRFGLVVIGRLPPRRAKQSLAFDKHKQKVRCSCMYFLQLLTTKPCIQIFDIVIMQ